MDDDQQFCLRWNNHQSTLISVFDTLLESNTLVDCTLAAEGKFLKAHKVVLSACSPYFATLLSQQYDKHPIFILKDVKFQELRAMMDYMYRGEVNISQDQLAALLKAAESLQIKGLSDSRGGSSNNNSTNAPSQAHKSDAKSHVPAPPKASGLTIENKRPLLRTDFDADISGSREGSVSPSTRKRKKVNQRRKSLIEANNLLDNHDQHSNSSSHSNNQQQLSTSATSAPINNLSVTNTKKTDQDGNNQEHDHGDDENAQPQKRSKHDDTDNKQDSELMLEPKNEYDDDDDDENDDNVEDLTMDDEMLEDLEAGPSHGGEGSSQGYHWQNQEGQESSGQHRDAQGINQEDAQSERFPCPTCGKSYLRRRHLQRHMRDECVNIPPRFHCEMCPSKFRRKYHLVRHLNSKHGIIVPPTQPNVKSTAHKSGSNVKKDKPENKDLSNLFINNFDKFSVEALMMKQENLPSAFEQTNELNDVSIAHLGLPPTALSELNSDAMAQLGLQQTFQNLKNLFVNYTLNNVSN
ncbi:hypothetical protein PVAND_000385 [Polypedilum vanderplanki]|uniref:Longitudinals lacking protein n=1 Tax=Polypedilum vanderplanki TaxID=319348 RepID=A0A9J6BL48_POLVA|nr:hypothetical protein PVAND_000385 [Polypedilum vanderplanki]